MEKIIGKNFTRLTPIKENGRNNKNERLWLCECTCGNTINVTKYKLKKGIVRSCGCLIIDTSREKARKMGKNNKKHGLSNSRIYKIHKNMVGRCLNKNDMHFEEYGKRGIKVCDEWVNSFENFYKWAIENGYNDELTLDRIDVNGNYEPLNCRWSTIIEQNNNKRNNRYIEYNGETKTITQWAREYNIKEGTLRARIDRYGIDFEKALTPSSTKLRKNNNGKRIKVTNIESGEEKIYNSLIEFSKKENYNYSNIRYYFQKGKVFLNKYKIEKI